MLRLAKQTSQVDIAPATKEDNVQGCEAMLLLWHTFIFKEKVNMKSLSRVWLFATPWTVAYQAPLSMGFSRREYWSELPFPSPGDLPKPRGRTQVSCIASRHFYRLSHQRSLFYFQKETRKEISMTTNNFFLCFYSLLHQARRFSKIGRIKIDKLIVKEMDGPKFKSISGVMNLSSGDISKMISPTTLHCMKSIPVPWPKAKLQFQQWTGRSTLYSLCKCLLDVL